MKICFFRVLFFLLFSSLLSSAAALPISLCQSDDPFACWGNGECVLDDSQNTYCLCAAGWKGEHCDILDLLPVRRGSPGFLLHENWPDVGASSTTAPSWSGGALWEDGYWYTIVGMKKNTSSSASDLFADNCGIFKFRSLAIGGPYEPLGEIRGANNQSFGFRADVKRHPIDNSILIVVDGAAYNVAENDFGFGFTVLRYHTGSIMGPFSEHNLFRLGRNTATIGQQWGADPDNTDEHRFDCRMADPTLVILDDGRALLGYRGTQCCCDNLIGTWNVAGNHSYETASFLVADNWKGPYTRSGAPIFQGKKTMQSNVHMDLLSNIENPEPPVSR